MNSEFWRILYSDLIVIYNKATAQQSILILSNNQSNPLKNFLIGSAQILAQPKWVGGKRPNPCASGGNANKWNKQKEYIKDNNFFEYFFLNHYLTLNMKPSLKKQ